MKVIPVVALGMAIGLAAVGCQPVKEPAVGDTGPDATDGVWCGDPAHDAGTSTYINIHYADDGTPSASPQSCEVKQGTQITWRGPEGNTVTFDIDFPSGPPGRVEEGQLSSSPAPESRQKVKIVASGAPGTYKYGIKANGKHIDPDVKIKPN